MTIEAFPNSTALVSGGDALGKVSSGNSTTSLLTASSTFTGEWEDVSGFDSVVVSVATDQNGSYWVQFSPDGTNVDSSLIRYHKTNKINPPHRFTNTRKYCRIVFTNTSASDQTYLRLQTLYGLKSDLNAPLDATLAQDYDATPTRPSDWKFEIAQGIRQGWTTWNKWGYNPDIDTASAETVWSVGGLFARMTAADTLNISSSSASDDGDPAGVGAQSIIIYGVDEDYLEQTEVVTLNGTTAVTTVNQWLGVNRMSIYLAGSTGYNVGTITATRTTGGSVQAAIPATLGSTQHAFFFVPANTQFYTDWLLLNAVRIGGGSDPVVTVKMFVTSLVSGARYEVFRHLIDTGVENTVELKPSQPFIVGQKSLCEFVAETTINNTALSIRFAGVTGKQVGA